VTVAKSVDQNEAKLAQEAAETGDATEWLLRSPKNAHRIMTAVADLEIDPSAGKAEGA
jgi:hypothetical protein